MKNPDLACPDYWEGAACVDGDRCPTHSDCPYFCGDHGYLYQAPVEGFRAMMNEADWEKYKIPCECQK